MRLRCAVMTRVMVAAAILGLPGALAMLDPPETHAAPAIAQQAIGYHLDLGMRISYRSRALTVYGRASRPNPRKAP